MQEEKDSDKRMIRTHSSFRKSISIIGSGRQTVIDGMLWLSRTSGRGLTPMLRKRLRKLGHLA